MPSSLSTQQINLEIMESHVSIAWTIMLSFPSVSPNYLAQCTEKKILLKSSNGICWKFRFFPSSLLPCSISRKSIVRPVRNDYRNSVACSLCSSLSTTPRQNFSLFFDNFELLTLHWLFSQRCKFFVHGSTFNFLTYLSSDLNAIIARGVKMLSLIHISEPTRPY